MCNFFRFVNNIFFNIAPIIFVGSIIALVFGILYFILGIIINPKFIENNLEASFIEIYIGYCVICFFCSYLIIKLFKEKVEYFTK